MKGRGGTKDKLNVLLDKWLSPATLEFSSPVTVKMDKWLSPATLEFSSPVTVKTNMLIKNLNPRLREVCGLVHRGSKTGNYKMWRNWIPGKELQQLKFGL
ncbi:hypothetical protein PVK06_031283 [Gossypium arboreum]|uniref:Uncharacterized protein n=1 Tax=Gossypium arboreum TaxID=29729 RepID=A0ABR0NQJ9_GOSAR|nr:hypothetical protein PVK06_031283 [Gossypium arboreum]